MFKWGHNTQQCPAHQMVIASHRHQMEVRVVGWRSRAGEGPPHVTAITSNYLPSHGQPGMWATTYCNVPSTVINLSSRTMSTMCNVTASSSHHNNSNAGQQSMYTSNVTVTAKCHWHVNNTESEAARQSLTAHRHHQRFAGNHVINNGHR